LRPARVAHPRERLDEQAKLVRASDERRVAVSQDVAPRADDLPRTQRLRLALRHHRRGRPVLDRMPCRSLRRLVDEDPAWPRRALQARTDVHHISCRNAFAGARVDVELHERLARRDADPNGQVE
jgi:hypothetical protein